jgi:hypothetical protein
VGSEAWCRRTNEKKRVEVEKIKTKKLKTETHIASKRDQPAKPQLCKRSHSEKSKISLSNCCEKQSQKVKRAAAAQ